MAEMRLQLVVRSAVAILFVVACVPRPSTLASPTEAGAPATATPSEATRSPGGPTGPTPTLSLIRPTPLPAPTFLAYAVRSGDTLTSIARDFRTTPRSIAFWSRGEHPSLDPESSNYDPNRLEVGWILLLVPDAVFDEDQLPEPTPTATTAPAPNASGSPAAS